MLADISFFEGLQNSSQDCVLFNGTTNIENGIFGSMAKGLWGAMKGAARGAVSGAKGAVAGAKGAVNGAKNAVEQQSAANQQSATNKANFVIKSAEKINKIGAEGINELKKNIAAFASQAKEFYSKARTYNKHLAELNKYKDSIKARGGLVTGGEYNKISENLHKKVRALNPSVNMTISFEKQLRGIQL